MAADEEVGRPSGNIRHGETGTRETPFRTKVVSSAQFGNSVVTIECYKALGLISKGTDEDQVEKHERRVEQGSTRLR